MVSTSFSLSASTTRWYPSVSWPGASPAAAVTSGAEVMVMGDPPCWVVAVSPLPPTFRGAHRRVQDLATTSRQAMAINVQPDHVTRSVDKSELSAVRQAVLDVSTTPAQRQR